MTEAPPSPAPRARCGRLSLLLAAAGFGLGLLAILLFPLLGGLPEPAPGLLAAVFVALFMGLAPLLHALGMLAGLAGLWLDRRKAPTIAGIVANAASLAVGLVFYRILRHVADALIDVNTPL